MQSHEDTQALHNEVNTIPTDESVSETTGNHGKSRLSVDIGLAQNYTDRKGLPALTQADHEQGSVGKDDNVESGYIEIRLDESLQTLRKASHPWRDESEDESPGPPRDHVTGRILSEFGRSCLGCVEKGLRCTLNFFGNENESQCFACRRSKAQYCVRFQPLGGHIRGLPFSGPPWRNPNFFAGTPEDGSVPCLSREQLEDVLREFYRGPSGYVLGNYVAGSEVGNFALPPFNGADLPPEDQPSDYESMGWKDVLPVWKHRSLRPRRTGDGEDDEYEEQEERKKQLCLARDRSLLPRHPAHWDKIMIQVVDNSDDADDDICYLRNFRRYEPRESNLDDILGETW
ncbi:hypothetical protein GGS24DRAFT_508524 [Hypoxylon argillaceum]|nr:hypothetical protein GGS24DRAFT_508524 [Hypoxylon argillaceum]KAI1156024.1 hypothetical protein F4825DRAFT_447025 [Nemania diffusa]